MTTSLNTRFVVGVALAGAAALPLISSQAKAATVICNFSNPGTPCPVNSQVTLGDKIIQTISGPNAGTGIVDFEQIAQPPNGFAGDLFVVDIDYDAGLGGPVTGSTFDYKISIDPILGPGLSFDTARLGYAILGGNPAITKNVYSDAGFSNLITSLTAPGIASLGGSYTQLWVRDIITLAAGDTVDNIVNTFTQTSHVPGPLPLLGAGTAFGFSRRLRRRLKQRHCLG